MRIAGLTVVFAVLGASCVLPDYRVVDALPGADATRPPELGDGASMDGAIPDEDGAPAGVDASACVDDITDAGTLSTWTFDAGADGAALNTPGTLAFVAGEGCPARGALRLTVDFTSVAQVLSVGIALQPPQNLRGASISARVKVQSGSAAAVRMWLSGGDGYADGDASFAVAGREWVTVTLNTDKPFYSSAAPSFDPADGRALGVLFEAPSRVPTTLVVLVDTIIARR